MANSKQHDFFTTELFCYFNKKNPALLAFNKLS